MRARAIVGAGCNVVLFDPSKFVGVASDNEVILRDNSKPLVVQEASPQQLKGSITHGLEIPGHERCFEWPEHN